MLKRDEMEVLFLKVDLLILLLKNLVVMLVQVKKFGDLSRIKLIAKEAGDPVSETSTSLQSELWDALVNGCKDAVRRAGVDCKVFMIRIL